MLLLLAIMESSGQLDGRKTSRVLRMVQSFRRDFNIMRGMIVLLQDDDVSGYMEEVDSGARLIEMRNLF